MKSAEIVLIEDNPGDVYLVQLDLKENEIIHRLTHFESGNAAVENLCAGKQESATPDLILMDLNTPGTDGFAVLIKLKQTPHLAAVPIAILTSSRERGDRRRAENQGVRYIEKPSQLDEFLFTIGKSVKELLSSEV